MQHREIECRSFRSHPLGRRIPRPYTTGSAISSHNDGEPPDCGFKFRGSNPLLRRSSPPHMELDADPKGLRHPPKSRSGTCGRPLFSQSARGSASTCHVRSQTGPMYDLPTTFFDLRDSLAVTTLNRRRHGDG